MPTLLITGAARGIGLALTEAFARDGWTVFAGVRSGQAAQALAPIDGDVAPVALDVSDPASVAILAERMRGNALDILINNAGIYGPRETSLGEIDYPEFQEVLAVNTLGPVRMAEAFGDHLRAGSSRKIMTISSRLGSIGGNAQGGSLIYRTSKAAVNAAMRTLALELAPQGFTVTLLHPGWVSTDMGGPQAPVRPAESAAGLKKVIEQAGSEHNGGFFNHDGERLPW